MSMNSGPREFNVLYKLSRKLYRYQNSLFSAVVNLNSLKMIPVP